MDIKLKNIRKDKHLFNQVVICLLIFISMLIMINSLVNIINNRSYKVFGSGYLNSPEYACELDSLHAILNNSLYYEYYDVYNSSVKDKKAQIKKLSKTLRANIKLNIIEKYGAEVLYFIVDNNNGEIYTNTSVTSLDLFEKKYKTNGYTFINTTNNNTNVYINNEQKYLNVSYNLSNNFDMNDSNNYFLRDLIKAPTVYVAVNHNFSEDGYFYTGLKDYESDAYTNIGSFILCFLLSIFLIKIIKDKFGIKDTLYVLGKLFNDVFIEIRIIILLIILSSLNVLEFKLIFIFMYCLFIVQLNMIIII